MSPKPKPLSGDLIARKGEAAPAAATPPAAPRPAKEVPKNEESASSGKVRLNFYVDPDRYQRLMEISTRSVPRTPHQEILLAALDEYLKRHGRP